MKKHSIKKNKNEWALHLYIAGKTKRAVTAISNLKIICEENLKDNYKIEVIDLLKNPQIARSEQIIAVPTLVRKSPLPQKSIIGDLSDSAAILVGLGLS